MAKGKGKAITTFRVQLPKALMSRDLPKYFTRDEMREIIDSTPKDRDRLMLEVMWQTGARISELLMLKWSDVDRHARAIRIPTLKRRKPHVRVVPISDSLLKDIALFVADNNIQPKDRLFNVRRTRAFEIVKEACERAGFKGDDRCHPHTLRHSFAVNCVLQGVPVLVLNELLGHSQIENTLIYTKVLASDSRPFLEKVSF